MLWTLADNQGTVRDLVDSTGTIQNHITYDSFGQITGETNPMIDTRFGYTGRELDAETGQYYYRARYYDPEVGRFISEDPIRLAAFDTNLYQYVGNSPVNFTDPSGLIAANLVGAGIGGSLDLGLQLATNGGNISKVDWASVAVSTATGSLGVGLTAKIASLSTSAGKRIAWNAAGNAVLGAGDRVVRNALDGKCLDDNLLLSALVGGALGAAGEAASIAAPRVIGSSSGALGGVDDAARVAGHPDEIFRELSDEEATKIIGGGSSREVRGALREQNFADMIGGRVSKDSKGLDIVVSAPGVPKPVRIDVEGPNGELILVGGPAKAKNLSALGDRLANLKRVADIKGVRPIAAFEEGTPESVINLAVKKLGADNVIVFPQ